MQPSQWINAFLAVAALLVVVIVKELKSSIRSQHYYYCDYSTQFAFLIRQTVPGKKKKKSRKMGLRRNRNKELREHSLPDHYPVTHFREIF